MITKIAHYHSPLGLITMASDGEALLGLWLEGQKYFAATLGEATEEESLPIFLETKKWLDLYFRGEAPSFIPPLRLQGSAFRRKVWQLLLQIPYGQTTTYKEIAQRVACEMGRKTMSAQAVGGAVGHNPISLIVPCHRVLGADGSLTGYAGGTDKKAFLLEMENKSKTK